MKARDMGEEQSGFKVTDRRLFNADGSPRDIEPRPEPARDATGSATQPEPVKADRSATDEATAATATQPAQASQTSESSTEDQVSAEEFDAHDEAELPGAQDPASFINFLMSLATNAASALGMMPHPVSGESGVDLPLAKHWIDVLGMLRQKTRGNLAAQEDQMFEGLLADLRMQYVSLTSGPAQPPKFTGRDIIGGK